MIHSLYSNKEVFLRELISNASDAADKLRFKSLSDDSILEGDGNLEIRVDFDKEAKTVTVIDNGIGMNRDEVIANLGTIAKSGTAQFLEAMSGEQKGDSKLIGQFGVGFYSAFIVAKKVEVYCRRAGDPVESGVHWESEGEGEFSVENIDVQDRGTRIVLHLRDDAEDFADGWKLRSTIRKFSDHLAFPVMMEKDEVPTEASADEDVEKDKEKAAKKYLDKELKRFDGMKDKELKAELMKRNLSTKGKKAEFVERLTEAATKESKSVYAKQQKKQHQ